jgi:folate-binding protein YgfZ
VARALRVPDAAIRLEGKDVRRFCNGMFTNNARDLAVGASQRTAMCDAKGKLLGLMQLVARSDERFEAVLEGVSAAEFEERYGKYIVFDDVELTVLPDAVVRVFDADAAAVVAAAGIDPGRVLATAMGADVLSADADATIAALMTAGAAQAGLDELEVARVEAGRVRWPVDMPQRYLLHELGLRDEVCHFEKGCYIGQEIIHRLDVMGQIRKHLAGVRLDASVPEASELAVNGETVGKVTSVVRSPRFGWIGLAVIRKPADEAGTVGLVGDVAATASALPFG